MLFRLWSEQSDKLAVMSIASRLWGLITGAPEREPVYQPSTPPPAPPPVPAESVQLTFADPTVESLCRALTRQADDHLAARLEGRAAAMQVAQSQSGLAGIALELCREARHEDDRASLGEAALTHLKKHGPPGPWAEGLKLASTSSYAKVRWTACEQALAAAPGVPLAALGLSIATALPVSNWKEERVEVARKTLELLKDDPNARLALAAAGTSSYALPRGAIMETFLAEPSGDPVALALKALDQIPTNNYAEERALAGEEFARSLQAGRPALAMGLAAAGTSGYALPRRILVEAALENASVEKPQELAGLALAMVRAVPASNYGEEAAAAGQSLLKSLKAHPETKELAELALAMISTSSYQLPQRMIADKVLETAARGGTPVEAARLAVQAIPTSNYGEEAAAAALAALKRLRADPVADMAVRAMETSSYQLPQRMIAGVALEVMSSPDSPPLAQVALRMLEAIPTSNYSEEAAEAGRAMAKVLAGRYSGARDRLDRAMQAGDSSRERVAALREAFASIQGADDDAAHIRKLAEAVTGKAEPVAIVQKEDAIIVGGVRVKVRASDANAPRG